MKKTRSTKSALISSVLALFLCITMLIGTTFAWFTDSVTSANNIIKSGTLDVELYYADGTKAVPAADAAEWKDASKGAIFNSTVWEPGYTDAKHLMISNEGTLALKYQLAIIPNGEVSKLADVIDVYYIENGAQVATRKDLETKYQPQGTLADLIRTGIHEGALSADTDYVTTIVLKMRETAGNEYQDLSIGADFSIQLIATQMTEENDSFDNRYDVGAPYDLPAGVGVEDFGDNVAYYMGNFYANMDAALLAIHANAETGVATASAEAKNHVLYLKPAANLGAFSHKHVCTNLTVYGNGAYVADGGDQDFELDTYKYYNNNTNHPCAGITEELTLNIYNLKNFSVWGQRTTENTLNIHLYNCEDICRVYLSGTKGITNVNIVDSTFDGTNGYYDTAVYTNNPGTINLTNTTIKAYSVGLNQNNKSEGTQNINLTNCTFIDCATVDTCGTAAAYAAPVRVVATEHASAVSNLALNGCKFVYTTANKAVDGDILTLDKREGKANNGTVNVTVDGKVLDGILVGTADALTAAVKNAVDGDKIYFINDIVGNATAIQKADVDVTIDGCGKTYSGSITINGQNRHNGAETLTIQNINFVSNGKVDFIYAPLNVVSGQNSYAHNVTVDNCTFSAPTYNEGVVGVQAKQVYNFVVKNCTATNMHSLMQAESCGASMTVENATVVNCKSGVSFNNTRNAVIKNSNIESVAEGGYGIRHKGAENGYALTVENCTVSAWIPVLIRNMTGTGYTATFSGTNTLTAANNYGYEIAVAGGDWDEKTVLLPPTGSYTLTGAENFKLGISLTYEQFNEALRAANGVFDGEGSVIVVLKETQKAHFNGTTAQYFVGGTNVNITDPLENVDIKNVTFIYYADDSNATYGCGELQVFADAISFDNCVFENVSVSPWGVANDMMPTSATITNCTFKNLVGRYGIHQNRAKNLIVTNCQFIDCERGIHTNSSTPESVTITGCNFTGIGAGYGMLCLAENGDYTNATLNITGNTCDGVCLRYLNQTVSAEKVNAILANNPHNGDFVAGSKDVPAN